MRFAPLAIAFLLVFALAPQATASLRGAVAPVVLPADATQGPAEYDPTASAGSHLSIAWESKWTGPLMRVVDESGGVLLEFRETFSRTVQARGDGNWVDLGQYVGRGAYVRVALEGETASVRLNHFDAVTVGLPQPAELGRWEIPDPTPLDVTFSLARHAMSAPFALDGFTGTEPQGWTPQGNLARFEWYPKQNRAGWQAGYLSIRGSPGPDAAFLSVPVASAEGRYVAEISVHSSNALTSAERYVVAAGVAGSLDSPASTWEVRLAQDFVGTRHMLVYHGADGKAVVLSEPALWVEIPRLRVVADEPNGRVGFVVGDSATATWVKLPAGLPATEHVVFGDLGPCLCTPEPFQMDFDTLYVGRW